MSEPGKVNVDLLDPLAFIKREYLDREIVGEDRNKLLTFLICCSTFTDNPLSAVVKARSSAGKSWLVNRVLDQFRPLGIVIEFSRITPSYLENMASKNRPPKPLPEKNESDAEYLDRVEKWKSKARTIDLKGKILSIDELRGIQNAQAPKLIISEGRLRLGTVDVNRQSVELEVTGTPTIITTTTQAALEDPEFENRVLSINIDETEEQTKAILGRHAQRFADPAEDLTRHNRQNALVEFFSKLKPYKVGNPFGSPIAVDYPTKNIEARRDFPKLLALSNTLTWLNQNARRKAKKDLDLVLVADLADVEKVKEIALSSLRESLAGYSEKEDALLEVFKNEAETRDVPSKSGLDEANGIETVYKYLTVAEAAQRLRKRVRRGEDWARKHIVKLASEEYLEEHPDNSPGKKGQRFRFAELQPEVPEINTDKYSNEILPAWAQEYGYTLIDGSSETEQRIGVRNDTIEATPKQLVSGQFEPKNPRYAAYQPETSRTDPNRLPNPPNSVVSSRTEKSSPVEFMGIRLAKPTKKDLCRPCFNSKYRQIRGVRVLASEPKAESCEDCGRHSELRIRID